MRRIFRRICVALLPVFLLGHAGFAQKPAPKASAPPASATQGSPTLGSVQNIQKEIEALKKGQEGIRKELEEIKAMLISLGAPPPEKDIRGIEFELTSYPLRGSQSARLVMVDFTDYQCPYCGRYARDTLPKIIQQYVDSGKLRYAILDLPLSSHPKAPKAAEASHCAGDQEKFWEMHDQMMAKQELLDNLSSYATSLNLDISKFEECLKTNKYAADIRKAIPIATKLGIRAVPCFILAESDPKNPLKVRAIATIRGAMPLGDFQAEIDKALANLPK
jgi:protein-disulfide isomerase